MNRVRIAIVGAAMAGSLITGGVLGATLFPIVTASAATPATASPAPGNGSSTSNGGTFKPNEDPAHEAGESAAREAQENAGQRPTVP